LEVRTDAEGRAAATVEGDSATALASKEGVGHSGGTFLSSRHAAEETELVIEKPIEVHGLVLRADLAPAPGATVYPVASGLSSLQRGETVEPETVTTDANGRFCLELQRGGVYHVFAELDGARTFGESVSAMCTELPELVLSFPGAYALAGRVVDAAGVSVAQARVSAWREWQLSERASPLRDYERVSAQCD